MSAIRRLRQPSCNFGRSCPGSIGAIAVEFIETVAQVSAVMLVAQNLSKLV